MRIQRLILQTLLLLCSIVAMAVPTRDALNDSISMLRQHLAHAPKDKEALRKISFFYLNKADYDNAILYGTRLFHIGRDEKDDNGAVIYSHICLGQAHMMKGNVSEAYNHLGQARLIGEANKNDSALCSVYNGLGLFACNAENDYYGSISYYFKGIEAAKRCHYDRLYSILLTNIAGVYYLKADTTGLKYSLECYHLGYKKNDTYLIYIGATNTAYMYYLKKEYQQALKYLKEAENLMIKADFHDQCNVYTLYGRIMYRTGNTKEAIQYYHKALEKKDCSNISSVVNAYLGYSEILMDKKQYGQAIGMLRAALDLSYRQTSAVYRSDLLCALACCHEVSGNLKEALHYYKEYHKEAEKQHNAANERAIGEIRAKYDMERQENLIKQNLLELQEKESKMHLLIACLAGIIAVAVLLYYLYYRKNKLYLAIVRQNQEAFRHERQLHQQIKELQVKTEPKMEEEKGMPASEKYAQSSLTNEKKQDLYKQLEHLLQEQRVYTDNMLTKEKMAEMLGTNRTYLSQIINEQTNQTFTQFITGFRTREAVRLLSDPANQTPLKAISAELGFNSMTTFYRQFQLATGMTPTQYRNKVQEIGSFVPTPSPIEDEEAVQTT